MISREEIIQNSISFIEALSGVIDTTNVYDVENLIKLLVSANNSYLQSLIDFLKNYEGIDINGSHLIELLTIILEGRKELLLLLNQISDWR